MTTTEAKIEALARIWGWASYLHEGHPNELSQVLAEDVDDGRISEEDAWKIQRQLQIESDRILVRKARLKLKP